jgi:2-polyprenyl-3-methyl-5-hydroxy-6-metoxy-1,4-benzoquinol methylase
MSAIQRAAPGRFAADTTKSKNNHETPTPDRLMQIAWGFGPPLMLEAAVQHRVFDLLDQSPQTAEELAAQSGASVRGLTAILNALVSLEFLKRKGGRYALTPESAAFLVSTKPAYQGGWLGHITRQLLPRWMELAEVVRTGRPAITMNQERQGTEFFAEFVESLFPLSYKAAQALGDNLGIAKTTEPVSVLDLGAGSGVWGIALAQQSPFVRVQAVDWPRVLEVTKAVARREGVGDRLKTVGGDLLEADFGSGHQVATLGHILHSEGRARSRQLLRKTFAALAPGGTIAISEFMPNADRTGPPVALIFAVNMLVNTEFGDTFTFAEISAWLREAGFENPRLLEAPAPSPLVLATRPRPRVHHTSLKPNGAACGGRSEVWH